MSFSSAYGFPLGNHPSLTCGICVTGGAESIPSSRDGHLAEAPAKESFAHAAHKTIMGLGIKSQPINLDQR